MLAAIPPTGGGLIFAGCLVALVANPPLFGVMPSKHVLFYRLSAAACKALEQFAQPMEPSKPTACPLEGFGYGYKGGFVPAPSF